MLGNFKLGVSFSGGGALGIGPAYFMKLLEEDLSQIPELYPLMSNKNNISTSFDAFAGTSTGAILAGCMNENVSAKQIYELYRTNLKKIFKKYNFIKRKLPKVPTYDNSELKNLLEEYLPGKVSDWRRAIYIPVTVMNGIKSEKVWDLRDKDRDKAFVVLTSTAAPTYFDVIEDGDTSYCDGGLWANDPIMCLVAGLKRTFGADDPMSNWRILSFNTTMTKFSDTEGNQTLVGWAKYLLSEWIARSGDANLYEATSTLPRQIFRISPFTEKEFKLDSIDDDSIEEIITIWHKEYFRVRSELLGFLSGYGNRSHNPQ